MYNTRVTPSQFILIELYISPDRSRRQISELEYASPRLRILGIRIFRYLSRIENFHFQSRTESVSLQTLTIRHDELTITLKRIPLRSSIGALTHFFSAACKRNSETTQENPHRECQQAGKDPPRRIVSRKTKENRRRRRPENSPGTSGFSMILALDMSLSLSRCENLSLGYVYFRRIQVTDLRRGSRRPCQHRVFACTSRTRRRRRRSLTLGTVSRQSRHVTAREEVNVYLARRHRLSLVGDVWPSGEGRTKEICEVN